jgi:hypothetical protein
VAISTSKKRRYIEFKYMRWFDRIPFHIIILLAAWMAVAPISPEPHLVEKVRMLYQGTLSRPLDIFDLFFHLAPLVVLAIKVWRQKAARQHEVK